MPELPAEVELVPAAPCTGVGGGTPAVLCVREGSSGGDGTSAAPYADIPEALAAAADGDTIQVAAGIYSGNLMINALEIRLLGGFSDDFETRDVSQYPTSILGSGGSAAVTLTNARATRVEGFFINGGTGGGLCVVGGAPLISSNVIEGNDTRDRNGDCGQAGGGIGTDDADIVIVGNLIRNNIARYGGGVATTRGNVTIDLNTIQNNTGWDDHGGGMYIASTVTVSRNLIEGNVIGGSIDVTWGWGGGVIAFGEGNTATFISNVIRGNTAPSIGSGVFFDDGISASMNNDIVYGNACPESGGAGVYVDGLNESLGSSLTMRHVTIAEHGCSSTYGGNGVFLERGSTLRVENSILWGNDQSSSEIYTDPSSSYSAVYSDLQQVVAGTGNFSLDPLFVNAQAGDFHLRSTAGHWDETSGWALDTTTSPCIDAADPAASFDQEPSPNGGRAEVGAYGNTAQASLSP